MVNIEYLTPGDELGRCRFFLTWKEESGKDRAQVFFANPNIYGFPNSPTPDGA